MSLSAKWCQVWAKMYVEVIPLCLVVAGSDSPLPTGEEPIGKDAILQRGILRPTVPSVVGNVKLPIVKLHSHRNVCCLCGPTLGYGCSGKERASGSVARVYVDHCIASLAATSRVLSVGHCRRADHRL